MEAGGLGLQGSGEGSVFSERGLAVAEAWDGRRRKGFERERGRKARRRKWDGEKQAVAEGRGRNGYWK